MLNVTFGIAHIFIYFYLDCLIRVRDKCNEETKDHVCEYGDESVHINSAEKPD